MNLFGILQLVLKQHNLAQVWFKLKSLVWQITVINKFSSDGGASEDVQTTMAAMTTLAINCYHSRLTRYQSGGNCRVPLYYIDYL